MKIKLSQLKKEYQKAKDESKESFMFEGKYELLVAYAKYLIEHLENEYKRRGLRENVPFFEFKQKG